MKASFDLFYSVLQRKSGTHKNKGTSLWKSVLNSGLRKIRQVNRRNALRTQLDKGGRSERDKLDRRQLTKLTIPLSSDGQPLVYHSDRQALSTSWFRHAGLLATADKNCFPDVMWLIYIYTSNRRIINVQCARTAPLPMMIKGIDFHPDLGSGSAIRPLLRSVGSKLLMNNRSKFCGYDTIRDAILMCARKPTWVSASEVTTLWR